MWFQVLSLLIAVPCLFKGAVGLAAPGRFYGWRAEQYASARVPRAVLVAPLFLTALLAAAWYATLVHYAPWGWVVTAFLTGVWLLAGVNLWRWQGHREWASRAVRSPGRRRSVDLVLMALGAVFVALAVAVY